MQKLFEMMILGNLTLANRFIFPPIKTAYGTPTGNVTDGHLTYYRQIAQNGPGLMIIEPVAVTPEGKEHPKQLCIHLPESADELKKMEQAVAAVEVIGDAEAVMDIYTAVHDGYALALKY